MPLHDRHAVFGARATLCVFLTATVGSAAVKSTVPSNTDQTVVKMAERQLRDARQLEAEGEYDRALASYRSLTGNRDEQAEFAGRVGVVRMAVLNGDFELAYRESAGLAAYVSASGDALAAVADANWAYGRFDEAERAARTALHTAQDSPLAHLVFARALLARGNAAEALLHATVAATTAGGDARSCDVLGLAHKAVGRADDGARALGSCIGQHRRSVKSPSSIAPRSLEEMRLMAHIGPRAIRGARTTIPFTEIDGYVYIQATVNGGIPSPFRIDTGADAVVITSALAAQRLSADVAFYGKGNDAGQAGVIRSLVIGELTCSNIICNIRANALRLTPLSGGEALSPLALGLSLQIDYPNRRLTIARELDDGPSDVDVPLWMHRVPTVNALVDDVERRFIIDTASPVTTMSPLAAAALPASTRIRAVPVRLFDTWGRRDPQAMVLLPGPSFALGPLRRERCPIVVHDAADPERELGFRVGGLIGANFLKGYRVSFDLVRGLLRMRRADALN